MQTTATTTREMLQKLTLSVANLRTFALAAQRELLKVKDCVRQDTRARLNLRATDLRLVQKCIACASGGPLPPVPASAIYHGTSRLDGRVRTVPVANLLGMSEEWSRSTLSLAVSVKLCLDNSTITNKSLNFLVFLCETLENMRSDHEDEGGPGDRLFL